MPKKKYKTRFFKNSDTLTPIQPRRNTHPTDVVSPRKRFGSPTQGEEDNWIFRPKNCSHAEMGAG